MKSVKLYSTSPDQRILDQISEVLASGGIIIYPTDTVYAFGCDFTKTKAVERICRLKGLDPHKALLSFMCRDLSHLSQYIRVSNTLFHVFQDNVPGPFTFVFPTNNRMPRLFKHRKTVGIRIPSNDITQAILGNYENPLITASLGINHQITENEMDPSLILETYGSLVDLMVEGEEGSSEVSTVVDCTGERPEIIREGKGILR